MIKYSIIFDEGDLMKPGLGVGVMILKDNKVLLGLRNPNKEKASSELNGQGTWTMPGGKVEYMEKLVDAAKRELEKETSLIANDLKLICISDDMTETAHYVTVGFLVEEYLGTVKTMEPETILEWRWFDINNLPTNMYKPSKKVLDKYLKGIIYE